MSAAGEVVQSGDLRGKSREELVDMLRRQQMLLADKKFMCKLPDKGKKVLDFVEKVKFAIFQQEDLKRTAELLPVVRLEVQMKDKNFNKGKGNAASHNNDELCYNLAQSTQDCKKTEALNISSLSDCEEEEYVIETNFVNQNLESNLTSDIKSLLEQRIDEKLVKTLGVKSITDYENVSHMNEIGQNSITDVYLRVNQKTSTNGPQNCRERSRNASWKDAEMLANSFQGVTITDEGNNSEINRSKQDMTSGITNNVIFPLNNDIKRQPHYVEVLETRAKNPVTKNSKFRPNQFPPGSNDSSCSSSPGHSSGIAESPISAEERQVLERKHLDDITAARLPPLHHMPTQLLPLEESMRLQLLQKQSCEEIQAKLAAQKLAERLNIKMVTYSPEGEAFMKYREVLDVEDLSEE